MKLFASQLALSDMQNQSIIHMQSPMKRGSRKGETNQCEQYEVKKNTNVKWNQEQAFVQFLIAAKKHRN